MTSQSKSTRHKKPIKPTPHYAVASSAYLDNLIHDAVLHIAALQGLAAMIKAGIHAKQPALLEYYAQAEATPDENTVVIGYLNIKKQGIEDSLKTVSADLVESLAELKRLEKEARAKP